MKVAYYFLLILMFLGTAHAVIDWWAGNMLLTDEALTSIMTGIELLKASFADGARYNRGTQVTARIATDAGLAVVQIWLFNIPCSISPGREQSVEGETIKQVIDVILQIAGAAMFEKHAGAMFLIGGAYGISYHLTNLISRSGGSDSGIVSISGGIGGISNGSSSSNAMLQLLDSKTDCWIFSSTLISGYKNMPYQTLHTHQFLSSPNGKYKLGIEDCNLVLKAGDKEMWSTGTRGRGRDCSLRMQEDGNLVLYDLLTRIWATDIYCHPQPYCILSSFLHVKDTCGISVYHDGELAWESSACHAY